MDADSSYGGSDTAQDFHSGHDNSSLTETTNTSGHHSPSSHHHDNNTAVHHDTITITSPEDTNQFYHKNEITLPVNYEDETDFQDNKSLNGVIKAPHYLSTANLNINETLENHSNLEEMSKNYKSSSHLNLMEESPKSTRKKSIASSSNSSINNGVDNPAFDNKEEYDYDNDSTKKPQVKSTFDNNRPYNGELATAPAQSAFVDKTKSHNGDLLTTTPSTPQSTFDKTKPYNGDLNSTALNMGLTSPTKTTEEPLTEAVNLELINLKPGAGGKDVTGAYENGNTNGVTGIPVKKETDVEIGNPYDEYFVPVNEHRKYMRGEKLYVTMDKRNKKRRNKCLCWGICLCIVAAALIIGILAAVGVIGNQGPIQKVTARHLDGSVQPEEPEVKGASIFGLPPSIQQNEETTTQQAQRFTPGPPVSTVSNLLPTTETSMIQVPRALESQIVIDNLQFTPSLKDKNSTDYKQLAENLENELKNKLFNRDVLNYGAADIEVKVVDLSPGSVVVKYRITWTFKDGIHHPRDPMDEDMLKRKMRNILSNTGGFIDTFHVSGNTVTADRVLDLCKIDNNGCEFGCSFDYKLADFVCTCPEGKILGTDEKSCVDQPVTEPEEIPDFLFEQHHFSSSSSEPPVQPEPEPTSHPDDFYNIHHDPDHDHHETSSSEPVAEPEPEPTSEPVPEPKPAEEYIHYFPVEVSPEPAAEPEPEPTSEPEPQPKDRSESTSHENYIHMHHGVTEEPAPEPTTEPIPEHKVEFVPVLSEHYTVHPNKSEPTAEPEPAAEPEPTAEPTAEPAAEPSPEPQPKAEPEPVAEPTAEPSAEPTPELTPKPVSEPSAEPTPEPTPEPAAEPSTEPQPAAEPHPIAEPTAEPSPDPVTTMKIEMVPFTSPVITNTTTEKVFERIPGMEYTSSLDASSTTERKIEPLNETTTSSTFEHEIKPSPEPTTQPPHEINVEPLAEPTAEPAAEEKPIKPVVIVETTTTSTESSVIIKSSSENTMTTIGNQAESEERHNFLSHEHEIFAEPETTTLTMTFVETSSESLGVTDKISEESVGARMSEPATTVSPPTTSSEAARTQQFHLFSINGQRIDAQSSPVTHQPDNETSVTIPITVNNETMTPNILNAQVISSTTVNEGLSSSAEPKIYEVTTQQPSHMDVHISNDSVKDQIDHSTEMIGLYTTTKNDSEMVMGSQETHNSLHDMSPYLPELYNDTFATNLHLGEHLEPKDHHEEEPLETIPPPRLDNDQMNTTNPYDPTPADALLKVIPLNTTESDSNEISGKLLLSSTSVAPNEDESRITSTTPSTSIEENLNSTTTPRKVDELAIQPVVVEITTLMPENDRANITTTKSAVLEDAPRSTLSSDLINNVHSNTYFERLDDTSKLNVTSTTQSNEVTTKSEDLHNINHFKDFATSTEDLIALETTTNGEKMAKNSPVVLSEKSTTEPMNVMTTTEPVKINAEIVDTVTETVMFSSANEQVPVKTETETVTVEEVKATTETEPQHKYEVKETVADVTTTERLFLSAKSTTTTTTVKPSMSDEEKEQEDLSVVPLPEDDESDLNHLDSDPNDSFNDISEEEKSVFSKFQTSLDDSSSATTPKFTDKEHNLEKDRRGIVIEERSNNSERVATTTPVSSKETENSTITGRQGQTSDLNDVVKPVTEGYAYSNFDRCAITGQFQCANGTSVKDGSYCISQAERCDSVQDCTDGSDETGCEDCGMNFKCSNNGQCLRRHLVCDGINNCNDGSDELNCEKWECQKEEFSCGPGQRCLPSEWKCDGRQHCHDSSDETTCPPATYCPEDYTFFCREEGKCIPKSWRCDGKTDCKNSEDERSCRCTSEQFKCNLGGGCIEISQRCNGRDDCADRSDEWNCLRLEEETSNKKYLEVASGNTTWFPVCSDNNWNRTHSDMVCQSLGFPGSSQTETVTKPEGNFTTYFKLKLDQTPGSPLLSLLEKTESCDNFISVTCQEFSCGNHWTTDNGAQSARIINGNKATETQWPSLTLLHNKRQHTQCTATLLSPQWAITSHSCVFGNNFAPNPLDWILYAGSTNFLGNSDNSTTQTRQVKLIVSHPKAKFSLNEYTNDLVLMELSQPLALTRNVSALCLPDVDLEHRQVCIVAGWGVSQPGESNKKQYLHYLPVPIIDIQECNSTKHYNGMMGADKICAGYTDSDKSPCYSDEGAPLMCYSESTNTWELQGVLSHHDNCGRGNHPAVYTSISSKVKQWVIDTIGQKPSRSA